MKPIFIVGGILALLVGVSAGFIFFSPSTPSSSLAPSSQSDSAESSLPAAPPAPAGVRYKEIANPSGFVNTEGLSIGELVGKKVVLVDFMTYSCINCQRTFPYLTAWYKKYKDMGLEIVGIHTPEFAFEKNRDNVLAAMKKFGIEYPVVLDNDYATWRNYENSFWPRKYLIDIHGNIVYDHIGEGAYEETELKIQSLLVERAAFLGETGLENESVIAETMPPAPNLSRSPETYFGAARNEFLANGPGDSGEWEYLLAGDYALNALYLGGTWKLTPEYAEAVKEARIVYRYSAKEIFLVASADTPVDVEVFLDGVRVNASAGADVKRGVVRIGESRLYKLIKSAAPGEHVLELRVKGKGLQAYAFTFR